MNAASLLLGAIVLAISSDWSPVDHHKPDLPPRATNSAASGRQSGPYQVTFKVPAHTKLEGDLELAIQNDHGPDTVMVPAAIQVYNTFTKQTRTVSMCLPHRTMTQKSTFEIEESPQPKQVIITFSNLPGQSTCEAFALPDSVLVGLPDSLRVRMSRHRYKSVLPCQLVGLPQKRLLRIPTNRSYVETSVQAACMVGSVATNRPGSSSIKTTVRFRKYSYYD